LVNRNKMIKSYNGCDGLKTGFTEKSKYCISSTAKRNNIRFISVIMGAPSWKERNAMAGRLLD
ncbi:MAG TPA: D-alanyl-D-alanine carboxypeptidase, partial [Clostridiaceae bacterium]|nr:D-alanyl-D-alanine carboxypeptidase [Clostridiaceae bacterium]